MTGGHAPSREDLGRAPGAYGQVVLRRCGAHVELVVDGVFAMDDVDTATVRAIATEALRRCRGEGGGADGRRHEYTLVLGRRAAQSS